MKATSSIRDVGADNFTYGQPTYIVSVPPSTHARSVASYYEDDGDDNMYNMDTFYHHPAYPGTYPLYKNRFYYHLA